MFFKKCRRGITYCKTVTIRQPKAPPLPRALSSEHQFGIELTQTPKPLTPKKIRKKTFSRTHLLRIREMWPSCPVEIKREALQGCRHIRCCAQRKERTRTWANLGRERSMTTLAEETNADEGVTKATEAMASSECNKTCHPRSRTT
jgi:hypothetical protein